MKNIESLSIRARVAYGTLCLEKALNNHDDKNEAWQFVLDKFWLFTNLEYVDEWLYIISKVMPDSILDDDFNEESGITLEEHKRLKKLYKNTPQFIFDIMEGIFNCGRRHLYGAVTPKSPETVEFIKSIKKIMSSNKMEMPKLGDLKKYSINEHQGWGTTFERRDLFKIEAK